jgi:hypothetical protein
MIGYRSSGARSELPTLLSRTPPTEDHLAADVEGEAIDRAQVRAAERVVKDTPDVLMDLVDDYEKEIFLGLM